SGYWLAVFKQYFPITSTSPDFLAFWKSDAKGRPANGGTATIARNNLFEKLDGPLKICTASALHATLDPPKYEGERLWLVALAGELQFVDDKIGTLEREIICEVKEK